MTDINHFNQPAKYGTVIVSGASTAIATVSCWKGSAHEARTIIKLRYPLEDVFVLRDSQSEGDGHAAD